MMKTTRDFCRLTLGNFFVTLEEMHPGLNKTYPEEKQKWLNHRKQRQKKVEGFLI